MGLTQICGADEQVRVFIRDDEALEEAISEGVETGQPILTLGCENEEGFKSLSGHFGAGGREATVKLGLGEMQHRGPLKCDDGDLAAVIGLFAVSGSAV